MPKRFCERGKKATKTKDTCNGKSEVFLGHMALMWTCDCTCPKDKPSWRRVQTYFTYFHFLKHLSVMVINLLERLFAYSLRMLINWFKFTWKWCFLYVAKQMAQWSIDDRYEICFISSNLILPFRKTSPSHIEPMKLWTLIAFTHGIQIRHTSMH